MTLKRFEKVILLYLYAIFPFIYTRWRNDLGGETTSGAKRLVGTKRLGGKRLGRKRLGGETARGGNGFGRSIPDSTK